MSALFTARANLNIISHNIANAARPGFSRQYAMQKATAPLTLYNGRGMYGTGSEVFGVGQIRDFFLDKKIWRQNSVLGHYTTKVTQLSLIETVFSELPDCGLRSAFGDFFNRLQDLTTTANDATFRSNVVLAAESLAGLIRANAEALIKQQSDINGEIEATVMQINSIGTQIASINKQIFQYEIDGSTANDLRDARALLVDKLSELINIEVEELDYSSEMIPHDKRFVVLINGYDLVNHTRANLLSCIPRENPNFEASGPKRNQMDADGLYDIFFGESGSLFNIYSPKLGGRLRGLIDVRDGNNTYPTAFADPSDPYAAKDPYMMDNTSGYMTNNFKGIPFYMNKLNILVHTFVRAINEGLDVNYGQIPGVTGHMYGYDANGDTMQNLFFTYQGYKATDPLGAAFTDGSPDDFLTLAGGNIDYSPLTALNLIVNPRLADPKLLACTTDPTIGESSNDVIRGFAKLNAYPSLFKEGKLMDFIIGTSDHLAIDLMQAEKFEESYYNMVAQTENQRLSVSGVDLNEELAAMIKYNQLYQAAAKLINSINDIYNIMINHLGLK